MNIRAVIMAGGSGTRFWPLSRKTQAEAVPGHREPSIHDRGDGGKARCRLSRPTDIFTIADRDQTAALRNLLPDAPEKELARRAPGQEHGALPDAGDGPRLSPRTRRPSSPPSRPITSSANPDGSWTSSKPAAKAAYSGDRIVTFGIPPDVPVHGLRLHPFLRREGENGSAESSSSRSWNSRRNPAGPRPSVSWPTGTTIGIRACSFGGRTSSPENSGDTRPKFFPFWERMLDALEKKNRKGLRSVFEEIPALSIDYALMEKGEGVLVCAGRLRLVRRRAPGPRSIEVWPPDEAGNAVKGEKIALDSQGCLVYAPGKLTALVGVKDLIVVDAGDALLICRKDLDQKVKDIVEILKKENKTYL